MRLDVSRTQQGVSKSGANVYPGPHRPKVHGQDWPRGCHGRTERSKELDVKTADAHILYRYPCICMIRITK